MRNGVVGFGSLAGSDESSWHLGLWGYRCATPRNSLSGSCWCRRHFCNEKAKKRCCSLYVLHSTGTKGPEKALKSISIIFDVEVIWHVHICVQFFWAFKVGLARFLDQSGHRFWPQLPSDDQLRWAAASVQSRAHARVHGGGRDRGYPM